jgi:hypothetical protein
MAAVRPAGEWRAGSVRPPPSGAQGGSPDRLSAVDREAPGSKTASVAASELSADAAGDATGADVEVRPCFRCSSNGRRYVRLRSIRPVRFSGRWRMSSAKWTLQIRFLTIVNNQCCPHSALHSALVLSPFRVVPIARFVHREIASPNGAGILNVVYKRTSRELN